MPSRAHTADQTLIALPNPDYRLYDVTDSPAKPHNVLITVSKHATYQPRHYWTETYSLRLNCVKGRCHTFSGTGLYRNGDTFAGPPFEEAYQPFEMHLWEREERWQTVAGKGTWTGAAAPCKERDEEAPLLASDVEQERLISAPFATTDREEDLIIELSPSDNVWDQRYAKRHELFYRTLASGSSGCGNLAVPAHNTTTNSPSCSGYRL